MPIHRELESAKTYFRKKNKEERSKYFSEVFQRNGDFWDLKENSTKSDQENLIRDYEQRNPGFESQNVPDDGNCFYHALKLGLESHMALDLVM
ncbi:MAG: hypothetical protein AB8B66_04455 [Rickettsiaceae bacterium]